MKNIQVIDNSINCVYDIFSATDEEFSLIFPHKTDIAFIDEVYEGGEEHVLDMAFNRIWTRRVRKADAIGIHGLLFYGFDETKKYYPTRKDEEAINSNGSRLRSG